MGRHEVVVRRGDISKDLDRAMRVVGVAGWDIETTGLDFGVDQIRTCQVFVPDHGVEIVQLVDGTAPTRLMDALASERIFKIFHYAPFDLRFMRYHWGVRARNVGCTKAMSKIVAPERSSHSLKPLVDAYLDVHLDKGERLSDWSVEQLSESQRDYAANDVVHLVDLYLRMRKEAVNHGVLGLVEQTFNYIPVRVETDLLGAGDVLAY